MREKIKITTFLKILFSRLGPPPGGAESEEEEEEGEEEEEKERVHKKVSYLLGLHHPIISVFIYPFSQVCSRLL